MTVSVLVVAHLVLVAAYAGFQWTVRALVYPQFAGVGAGPDAGSGAGFIAYERAHQQRVTRVVGPLFVGQGLTTVWLLVLALRGQAPAVPVLAGAACLGVVLLVTALGAVPLHRTLSTGWDRAAHRRLLRVDSVRAVAASAGVLAAAWLLLG